MVNGVSWLLGWFCVYSYNKVATVRTVAHCVMWRVKGGDLWFVPCLLGTFCILYESCNPLSIFPSRKVFSSLLMILYDWPEAFKSRTAFLTLLTPVGNVRCLCLSSFLWRVVISKVYTDFSHKMGSCQCQSQVAFAYIPLMDH